MKVFNLLGNKISISQERDNYNKIRLTYTKLAQKAQKEFENMYKQNKNLDDVINNSSNHAIILIKQTIEYTVNLLIQNKFYNIDEQLFLEKYCQDIFLEWDKTFDSIYEKYMDITLDEKQKEAYRQYKKDTRGRWQGGGFGLQGAIKGAITAGAMNAASGIAQSTVNIVGRMNSSTQATRKKAKIFNDSITLNTLLYGIYDCIFNIHYSYMKFLEENSELEFQYIYDNEYRESEIIFSNLKERNIINSDKISLLKKIIELNPYKYSLYIYILDNFGDENKEVSTLANYFGYDIESYKMDLIKNKLNDLKTSTKSETLETKKIILNEAQKLGLDNSLNIIKNLDQKLEQFDRQARTVENIIFKTKEEAELAKSEKSQIDEIIYSIDMQDEDSIKRALQKIDCNNFKTRIVELAINKLNNKLKELDVQARTVENIIFKTREEANLAKSERFTFNKIITNINIKDEDSIQMALQEIDSNNFKTVTTQNTIDELNNKLKELDQHARTVGTIIFKTREEAQLAKSEKLQIDKIISTIGIKDENKIEMVTQEIESNNFKTIIAKNTIDMLNRKSKILNKELRTIGTITFETKEEADLAKSEKLQIENILKGLNIDDEVSLLKVKKQIQSKKFKTKIVNPYLKNIEQHLQDIYSKLIDEAKKHEKNKEEFKSSLFGSIFIFIIGFYFFDRVGFILKIIISITVCGCIGNLIEEYKELQKSSKAMKNVKKLKKSEKHCYIEK